MAGAAALPLPTPQLAVVGKVGNGAISGTVSLALPAPRLRAINYPAGTVALALPRPLLLTATGNVPIPAAVGMVLPTPTLVAKGTGTIAGSVALTLPLPQLRTATGNQTTLTLPAPAISVHAATGVLGTVQFVATVPTLIAGGQVPAAGTAALQLPKPVLAISGRVGNIGAVNTLLRGIALAAVGHTGVIGTCELTLPVSATLNNGFVGGITAAGGTPAVGQVSLAMPMLLLRATGPGTAAPADSTALPAFVMHTETGAITQYANFAFNSFATFNGVYLGANAEGLFVIASGNTDNTVAINAAARVGITDFGTSFLKRIDRCYVGYRADGNITLRVYTDEVNMRDYMLEAYGKGGLHGNHTRIGKGLAARYWQFELISNGADFELNALELKPTHLRRRIGGGDA